MPFADIPDWMTWKRASSSTFQVRSHKPTVVRIDTLIRSYPTVPAPRMRPPGNRLSMRQPPRRRPDG